MIDNFAMCNLSEHAVTKCVTKLLESVEKRTIKCEIKFVDWFKDVNEKN